MGYQQYDYEDEWEGLEPEQPEPGASWVLWVGAGLAGLFLVGICVGAGYLLLQQFQNRTEVPPTLALPTSPLTPTETAVPESTTPSLAPTATVSQPQPEASPTPASLPVGPGNVDAERLSTLPTIDGELSEWSEITAYESTFRVYSADSWDGTDDLTAVWRLGWDDANLYVGVEVRDDVHVQTQTGNQIFRGDSVDMQFDTDRDGDFGPGLSPDDFQITLSPGNFADLPPSAFRFQGTENGRILDAPGRHQVTVAAQETSEGYTLEAAIPWTDLNLTPRPGLVIGVALNANDNDQPETAVQEVMMSHVAGRTLTDPTSWGTLTLK